MTGCVKNYFPCKGKCDLVAARVNSILAYQTLEIADACWTKQWLKKSLNFVLVSKTLSTDIVDSQGANNPIVVLAVLFFKSNQGLGDRPCVLALVIPNIARQDSARIDGHTRNRGIHLYHMLPSWNMSIAIL